MQAVVLAGGLATRMRPHTERVPKAMLEVAGRPFIEWQLERLAGAGFAEVVMCIAHLGDQLRAHVGDGARWGVRVVWAEEPPGQLLGTAGAVRAALGVLAPTFLVTYGDSYLPFDYAAPLEMLAAHDDCDGVMAVFRNADQWEVSNVITDGTWVQHYDKRPTAPGYDHVDYGAMALRRDVIAALPAGVPSGLDVLQHELAARGRLRACVARERFFEIGSPAGLAALDRFLGSFPGSFPGGHLRGEAGAPGEGATAGPVAASLDQRGDPPAGASPASAAPRPAPKPRSSP